MRELSRVAKSHTDFIDLIIPSARRAPTRYTLDINNLNSHFRCRMGSAEGSNRALIECFLSRLLLAFSQGSASWTKRVDERRRDNVGNIRAVWMGWFSSAVTFDWLTHLLTVTLEPFRLCVHAISHQNRSYTVSRREVCVSLKPELCQIYRTSPSQTQITGC